MAEMRDAIPDDERTHAELADLVMPALLRGAREAYRAAVRSALAAGGYDDLPPNGAFVVGAVTHHGVPLADAVSGLRVSKRGAPTRPTVAASS
jgi:hypothetical protein